MKKMLITAIIISVLLFSAAVVFFIRTTQANPIINVYKDISPPEGTQPPIITIHTPTNRSAYPKNATLTFDVIIPKTNGEKSLSTVTRSYLINSCF